MQGMDDTAPSCDQRICIANWEPACGSQQRRSAMKRGRSSGTGLLVVFSLIMAGCVATTDPKTSTADVSTAEISGRWEGTWRNPYGSTTAMVLNLTQNGADVAGSIEMWNFSGPVQGTLAGNRLTFTSPGSRIVRETLTVKENYMSGDVPNPVGSGYRGEARLTRQK